MRDNTPDQPTPEQEQNKEQTSQKTEHPPLQTPDSETSSARPDALSPPAPDKQETPARHAPDAGLRRDQEILHAKEPAGNDARPSQAEIAPEDETPLSMQPEARPTRPESPWPQKAAEDGGEQESAPEVEPGHTSEQTPEQKPESVPTTESIPAPSKCFGVLSWITPLLLAVLALALFAPLAYNSKITGLEPKPNAQPQLAAAIETAEQGGDLSFWFIPHVAGQPAPEVPPLQLWWGAAANALSPRLSDLAGAWIGGWAAPLALAWLFLMAAASLGWTDSRFGRRAGLAAGLAAFCGPLFMAAAWLAPNLLLAPALSGLGAACILRGLKKTTFSLSVFLGCVLAALAGLAGGLIPAVLPLAAALIAIVGTLNFRRLGEWDLVFGLGLAVLILGGWLTGGLLFAGSAALRAYLAGPLLLSGGGSPLPAMPWTCFAVLTLAVLLPWPALPLCLPARSGKALLAGVKDWKNRLGFTEPLFLAGMLATGLTGLMLANPDLVLLLLLPAGLAALAARSLTNLTAKQNRRWGSFCALYLLALALAFAWLLLDSGREFFNAQLGIAANISFDVKTWLAPGAAALIGALTMWFFGRGKSSQNGLLVFAFALLLVSQSFAWLSLPALEPYLRTTRAQPELPVLDIVLPEQNIGPDGPRLHLPMPPGPDAIMPPATAAYNATQNTPPQLDILGAPMPARHNATSPHTLPAIIMPITSNATSPAPDSGLINGQASPPPLAQNATAPTPEAGNALYGDDLPTLEAPAGPAAPYQPGLHTQAKEPPLPVLDTPPAPPAPGAPLVDPYPPGNAN